MSVTSAPSSLRRTSAARLLALTASVAALATCALAAPAQAAQPTYGGAFTPCTPSVVADTRNDMTTIPPLATTSISIDGRGGVDALRSPVAAVTVVVTAVAPKSSGWLAVTSSTNWQPETSTLNFVKGQTISNLATVGLGSNRTLLVRNASSTPLDVTLTALGTFNLGTQTEPQTLRMVHPFRAYDSRRTAALAAQGTRTVPLAGLAPGDGSAGLPAASGISAVVLNVTAIGGTAPGYLTAWASGQPMPATSNVNYDPRQVVANQVVTPVGSDGSISLYNGTSGTGTQAVVDVTGYYTGGTSTAPGTYHPVTPTRVFTQQTSSPTGAYLDTVLTPVGGSSPVPATGVGAVQGNLTAVSAQATGSFTLYSGGTSWPYPAVDLTFAKGQTIAASTVMVPQRTTGDVVLHNGSAAPSRAIVDVSGFYAG